MTDHIPRCPHGMEIMRYDSFTYREAEQESNATGEPNCHPLPPFCSCCGQPCTLGSSKCQTCQQEVA